MPVLVSIPASYPGKENQKNLTFITHTPDKYGCTLSSIPQKHLFISHLHLTAAMIYLCRAVIFLGFIVAGKIKICF